MIFDSKKNRMRIDFIFLFRCIFEEFWQFLGNPSDVRCWVTSVRTEVVDRQTFLSLQWNWILYNTFEISCHFKYDQPATWMESVTLRVVASAASTLCLRHSECFTTLVSAAAAGCKYNSSKGYMTLSALFHCNICQVHWVLRSFRRIHLDLSHIYLLFMIVKMIIVYLVGVSSFFAPLSWCLFQTGSAHSCLAASSFNASEGYTHLIAFYKWGLKTKSFFK